MLQCRTNGSSSMYWNYGFIIVAVARTTRGVYHVSPGYSVNNSTKGQFDLVINSTQPTDAGSYSCTHGFDAVVATELILLGECFVLMCYYVNSVLYPYVGYYSC